MDLIPEDKLEIVVYRSIFMHSNNMRFLCILLSTFSKNHEGVFTGPCSYIAIICDFCASYFVPFPKAMRVQLYFLYSCFLIYKAQEAIKTIWTRIWGWNLIILEKMNGGKIYLYSIRNMDTKSLITSRNIFLSIFLSPYFLSMHSIALHYIIMHRLLIFIDTKMRLRTSYKQNIWHSNIYGTVGSPT